MLNANCVLIALYKSLKFLGVENIGYPNYTATHFVIIGNIPRDALASTVGVLLDR